VTDLGPLDPAVLLPGIRSRFLDDINGLRVHILEAGHETSGRPCVLLLHGFPELAYSWRKVMPPLAAAGVHVVAPRPVLSRPPMGPSSNRSANRRGLPSTKAMGVRHDFGT